MARRGARRRAGSRPRQREVAIAQLPIGSGDFVISTLVRREDMTRDLQSARIVEAAGGDAHVVAAGALPEQGRAAMTAEAAACLLGRGIPGETALRQQPKIAVPGR